VQTNSAIPISVLISENLLSLEKQEQKVLKSCFSFLTIQHPLQYCSAE